MSLPDTRYSLLARLAQHDDRGAWSDFLQDYEGAIYRYCRSRGLQEADAREVVQEVLLAVHSVIGRWEPSGRAGSFRAWLLETANRASGRALRDRAKKGRAVGGTSVQHQLYDLPSANCPVDNEQREWQRLAFCWGAAQVQHEVQEHTWQAFWLTAVEGESPAVVAERLCMSVGGVYAAKCRVLSRIRERIQELSQSEQP